MLSQGTHGTQLQADGLKAGDRASGHARQGPAPASLFPPACMARLLAVLRSPRAGLERHHRHLRFSHHLDALDAAHSFHKLGCRFHHGI